MSTTIDERVVSMQFDNKQFERNVQTSMGTIEKLKQSLNFNGASKGLENVNAAAKSVNLSGLSGAVETVQAKFSAFEVMAVTALANITNSAVNAGKRMISALTLDPVKSGLSEYETQIGAIQTILANTQSKGSTLDDVNSALDELNRYADKTIYNFTEMTRNIGTFTAAGVGLEESVAAIKGIANLAAVSGSTSQQASTAMYQLSQALASGTVRLQDWNSVVNAGMGGEVFQTALKRTATQMGTNVDALIEKYGSFRESLTQGGWLTTEVLTETLAQLSGAYTEADLLAQGYSEKQAKEIVELANTAQSAATDVKTFTQLIDTTKEALQSGWTQTWEYIIGDFEEAKELWSNIADVLTGENGLITKMSDARNKLLGGALGKSTWGEFTERIEAAGLTVNDFEKSVRNVADKHGLEIDSLVSKYGSFEAAVKAGAIETDILKESLDGLQKTSEKFNLDSVNRTLKMGVKGDDVTEVEKALKSLGYKMTGADGKDYSGDGFYGSVTEEAVKAFQKANNLKITGIVDEATLKALDEACNKTEKLDESVYNLIDGFDNLNGRAKLIEGFSNIFDGLKNIITPIKDAFREIFPPTTAEQLYGVVEGFAQLTANFKTWTTSAEGMEVIGNITSAFRGFFSVIDIGWTLVTNLVGGILDLLGSLLGFGSGIASVAGSIGDWVTGLRNSIKESNVFGAVINGIVGFLQNGINAIKSFFEFIGQKTDMSGWEGFMSLLSSIWNFIKKIGGMIANFGTAIGNIFTTGGFSEMVSIVNGGLFAMLLASLNRFIGGFTKGIAEGFGIFDSVKDMLSGVSDILNSVKDALTAWTTNIQASTLLKIAGALGILAIALMLIATIEPAKLSTALAGITVLLVELMVGLNWLSKTGIGNMRGVSKAVTAMIGISAAVLILASALKKLSDLGWEDLLKGFVGVTGLMGVMVVAIKQLSKDTGKIVKGAGKMILIAAALKILASVCKDLAELGWNDLIKGLVGVGALMAAVSLFMNNTKFSGKSVSNAIGILILSGAIKILASACNDFGEMSGDSLIKGLAAIGALLLALATFSKLTGNSKNIISTGVALVAIGAAMKIFASAITDLSALSWDQLLVGLTGLAGSLLAVALTTKLMPKNLISTSVGLVAVGAAMLIIANAMSTMGNMSWDAVGKSLATLAGSLLILAVALNFMKTTITGSAALLVASAALAVLAPVLTTLGNMSWGSIVKGLVAIAGALVILGVAGAVLGPLVPAIIGLSGAMALLGVGMLAIGAGVLALGVGIGILASSIAVGGTAIVAGIASIIMAVVNLIPDVLHALGRGVVEFCKAIGDSADAIGEAFKDVLLALVDVFVECVPPLVDGLLVLIDELLKSLAEHTPSIVESVVKVLFGIFEGVAAALKNIDAKVLLDGLLGIGVIAAIIVALSAITPFIPGALIGALGIGVIVAELAVVLAAIGALAQIPGLQWLVGEGGQFMQTIGNALGQFVGGIAGGVAEGFTASLPQIGTDLSTFMTNLQPFLDGAAKIDSSVVEGVGSIVDIILRLTAANILEGLTSWFTGGSSLTSFGAELESFGVSLANFSTSVSGVDGSAVSTAITAAQTLISVASGIPNSGGIISWFTGESNMGAFGSQLSAFGAGIKGFSDAVTGVNPETVTAAATAAKGLVDIAATIPSSGGIISWFTGEQDLSTFGGQLKSFGEGVKNFADSVTGLNVEAVTAGVNAAKTLTDIASTIPSTGGIIDWFTGSQDLETFGAKLGSFGAGIMSFASAVSGMDAAVVTAGINAGKSLVDTAALIPSTGGIISWFTGDQDIGSFGDKLTSFGGGIKAFADSVNGMNVESVTAGINAGKSLVEIASTIPSTGGIVDWFTGDQDLATFGSKLGSFGAGIKLFSDSVVGINAESVTAGITAAKSLVETASLIPNTGGIVSWFTGDQDLSSFGSKLGSFGTGVKAFADNMVGINSESVTAGAAAAKSLIDTASLIPSTGGIISWFTGGQDLEAFSSQLSSFGSGVKAFADNMVGIDSESVTTGITAAKSLIDTATLIPSSGGIVSWFTGSQDLSTYAAQLGSFGDGIKAFATAVNGINSESVTTAATAASTLITAAASIPNSGGIVSWFTGDQDLSKFGTQLGTFGSGIKTFSDNVTGINVDSVTAASTAATSLATIASGLPESDTIDKLKNFGDKIKTLGSKLKEFSKEIADITWSNVSSATTELGSLSTTLSSMPKTFSGANSFADSLKKISKTSIDDFVKAFTDAEVDVIAAGEDLIGYAIDGVDNKETALCEAVTAVVTAAKTGATTEDIIAGFTTAGSNIVDGFVSGISANTYKAEAQAAAMANAALVAAEAALGIKSPSKEFYQDGAFAVMGFVNALSDYERDTYKAGYTVGETAKLGLSKAVSKVKNLIENGIDDQPTIRPVLDLSEITAGADGINSLFGMNPAIAVAGNLGNISAMMGQNQNGGNEDVVAAINGLGTRLAESTGDSYSIGSITYDDGSSIAELVKALVKATLIGGRV